MLTATMRSKSVLGQVLERLRQVADAGVVDQDVEPAEVRLGGLDHRAHVGGLADVDTQRPRRVADARGHVAARPRRLQVGDQHLRAFGDELARDAGAEARAAAGDDRHLVLQSHVAPSSAVLDGHRLQRREAVQRLEALLAPVARGLDAAEGQLDAAAGAVVVDEHLAAFAARAPCAARGCRRASRPRPPGRRRCRWRCASASASPSNGITTCTGPKISSCASRCVGRHRRQQRRRARRSRRRGRSAARAACAGDVAAPLSRASAR